MIESDISSLAGFLETIWVLIREVLKLNPVAFEVALASPGSGQLGLVMLFLAELSMAIGQSVVLFANRITRLRFIFSLAFGALGLLIGVVFWGFTIWILGDWLFGQQRPFTDVLVVVSLSQVPLLFGFLVLIPYLGNIINSIIHIWTLLALLTGIMVLYQFTLLPALICALLGWLIIEIANRTKLIMAIERWFWRAVTNTPSQRDTQDIVEEFVAEVRATAIQQQGGES